MLWTHNKEPNACEAVKSGAQPLYDDGDYQRVAQFAADGSVVLLGEATHGTHDFYAARARITRALIEQHGFSAVAIEGDWPDAWRVQDCGVGAQLTPRRRPRYGDGRSRRAQQSVSWCASGIQNEPGSSVSPPTQAPSWPPRTGEVPQKKSVSGPRFPRAAKTCFIRRGWAVFSYRLRPAHPPTHSSPIGGWNAQSA